MAVTAILWVPVRLPEMVPLQGVVLRWRLWAAVPPAATAAMQAAGASLPDVLEVGAGWWR